MDILARFLLLCILYTDVIRIVVGKDEIKFPHETYVQLPDPADLKTGIKRFTTKAKGSLVSLTNVLTVDRFSNEPDIQIVSFEDDSKMCKAKFLFQSKKIDVNLLEVPSSCTSPSKVISLPPIRWRAEVGSEAAVSYHEGTSKIDHWAKTVIIETVSKTEYELTAKSQQEVRNLLLGSSLVQLGNLIGIRTDRGSFTIVDHVVFMEEDYYTILNAMLSKVDKMDHHDRVIKASVIAAGVLLIIMTIYLIVLIIVSTF